MVVSRVVGMEQEHSDGSGAGMDGISSSTGVDRQTLPPDGLARLTHKLLGHNLTNQTGGHLVLRGEGSAVPRTDSARPEPLRRQSQSARRAGQVPRSGTSRKMGTILSPPDQQKRVGRGVDSNHRPADYEPASH
jgi:hypothetical protein